MRFLIPRVVATDPQLVTASHLRLLADATSAFDDDDMMSKCLNFVWKRIESDSQSQSVRDSAMELFCQSRTNLLLSRMRWRIAAIERLVMVRYGRSGSTTCRAPTISDWA